MNKRIRKKHRLGEFQELGFELVFSTPESWTEADHDAFWLDFIEALERLDLGYGGGGRERWEGFVTRLDGRGSVTEEQRAGLVEWLEGRDGISEVRASTLKDAWYGEPEMISVS